jgi:hypothetical protein
LSKQVKLLFERSTNETALFEVSGARQFFQEPAISIKQPLTFLSELPLEQFGNETVITALSRATISTIKKQDKCSYKLPFQRSRTMSA